MTASKASQPPGAAPPAQDRRRRPVMRRIVHVVLFIALAVGIFGLLPRLGGLTRDAAELRHARPGFVVAAVIAQGISLGCYALLYRRVLASLGARVPFWMAARITLASFLVSHITPFGSATGTVLNVSTLEAQGIAAATTGEAIALTSLMSTVALIVLFGAGFAATAGRVIKRPRLYVYWRRMLANGAGSVSTGTRWRDPGTARAEPKGRKACHV
jgi:uncharacterized membrane protein YbhN (UPF0104 family)